ncbi:hypothetical protein PSEUDO8AS_10796 [Pseudomonas sp. 8AS]|nr:hypothetical protein PSEUDO8AS_10796 [Pseudomonas sp. 8AS]
MACRSTWQREAAVAYRCGGSAGMARDERTGFPFNAHCNSRAHLGGSKATRTLVRG